MLYLELGCWMLMVELRWGLGWLELWVEQLVVPRPFSDVE